MALPVLYIPSSRHPPKIDHHPHNSLVNSLANKLRPWSQSWWLLEEEVVLVDGSLLTNSDPGRPMADQRSRPILNSSGPALPVFPTNAKSCANLKPNCMEQIEVHDAKAQNLPMRWMQIRQRALFIGQDSVENLSWWSM